MTERRATDIRKKQTSNLKKDLIFTAVGLVFAAVPYIYPQDFLYFRFPFFVFIAYEFGLRAGLLTTLPNAMINLFIQPKWGGLQPGEAAVLSAMIISGPIAAYIASQMKKWELLFKRILLVLIICVIGLCYMTFQWLKDKPNIFKIPIICTIAVAAYFLYRYRKHLSYIQTLLWILVIYYFASFAVYIPIIRFNIDLSAFYQTLLSLFPADVLSVILGAAVLPQLENLSTVIKKDNSEL